MQHAKGVRTVIRVLVVDDSATAREHIAAILNSDPEMEVVGEAADGAVLMLTAKGGVDENVNKSYEFATRVQDRLHGFDVGAAEFLTKPVKAKELVKRVKSVLWAGGFPV